MSIIFNRIEQQAKSIALTYTSIMRQGNVDYQAEQEKLKNVLIDFSRSIRLEAVASMIRELYEDDMTSLAIDLKKVQFLGDAQSSHLEDKGKVLMYLNPKIRQYLGPKYYGMFIHDIENKIALEEYADIIFPEVF